MAPDDKGGKWLRITRRRPDAGADAAPGGGRQDAAPGAGRRGAPLPVVWGLIAALVGAGLYAAWPAIDPAPREAAPGPETAVAPPDTPPHAPQDAAGPAPDQGGGKRTPPADETPPAPAETARAAAGTDAQAGRQAAEGAEAAAARAALRTRLEALEARADGAAAVLAGGLERRIEALEREAAQARADPARAAWTEQRRALEARLAATNARLARLEADATRRDAADGRLMALVLVTGELTAALGTSRPFAAPLDRLRGVAGADPEIAAAIAPLAPFAAAGAPTLDGLAARFPPVANALLRAAQGSAGDGWIDATVSTLRRLVTVRRTGGAVDPESLDGRLAAAETALAAGDPAPAIALAEDAAPAADGVRDWLRGARARRAADDALARLAQVVNARVGARWAASEAAR